jgi:hypothetical protein
MVRKFPHTANGVLIQKMPKYNSQSFFLKELNIDDSVLINKLLELVEWPSKELVLS